MVRTKQKIPAAGQYRCFLYEAGGPRDESGLSAWSSTGTEAVVEKAWGERHGYAVITNNSEWSNDERAR